jgi:hypothetical protein
VAVLLFGWLFVIIAWLTKRPWKQQQPKPAAVIEARPNTETAFWQKYGGGRGVVMAGTVFIGVQVLNLSVVEFGALGKAKEFNWFDWIIAVAHLGIAVLAALGAFMDNRYEKWKESKR